MPRFDADGVPIAYDVVGDGPPVVLVHGFASNRKRNWEEPRWFATLSDAGRGIVALDCRGHGESGKPHRPAAYTAEIMSGDVLRLMDHLDIARADIMGYSMGGRLAAELLARHADRFGAGVLAGVGAGMLGKRFAAETIASALEAPGASGIDDPSARAFRTFAEQGRNDLVALAASMRGLSPAVEAAELRKIPLPVLVVAGDKDTLIGDPRRLADCIPNSRLFLVPGRDHMNTVGDRRFKEAVVNFLSAEGLAG